MHEIAARAKPRRPAHPGQHDVGAPSRDLAAKRKAGRQIERAAKAQLGDRDPGLAQASRPGGVAADQDLLRFAGALQRRRQAHEKGFGAAVTGPSDRLQQAAGHVISASNWAATASQLNPR